MTQRHKTRPSLVERWARLIWGSDFDSDPVSPSREEAEPREQRRLGFAWKIALPLELGVTPRTKSDGEQE
jgi:hypothetical protein